jgi:SAM-dependent methyltransferase
VFVYYDGEINMSQFPEQIVPWGRTAREYELMFSLSAQDLAGGVLDCGGGPSAFTAEMTALGYRVVAVDPIYDCAGADIRARFDAVAEPMLKAVRENLDSWNWSFHRDPEGLIANRRAALESFLKDYEKARRPISPLTPALSPLKGEGALADPRYIVGELPNLPIEDGVFGLAICSHLLFLYSDRLTEEFHVEAVRELCRVAREVRIFPLLTLEHDFSPHMNAVRSAMVKDGWKAEVVKVEYEFQRGGNEMLRVFRA